MRNQGECAEGADIGDGIGEALRSLHSILAVFVDVDGGQLDNGDCTTDQLTLFYFIKSCQIIIWTLVAAHSTQRRFAHPRDLWSEGFTTLQFDPVVRVWWRLRWQGCMTAADLSLSLPISRHSFGCRSSDVSRCTRC